MYQTLQIEIYYMHLRNIMKELKKEYISNGKKINMEENMKRYCLLLICLLISLPSYVYGSDKICKIVLNNGDVFTGEIISQTLETITVKTEYLTLTIKNSDIKSIENNPLIQENYKYVTVKKYDNLPMLLLTIGGGIFAYTQFDKSKEHKNIATPMEY